ncbi:MAG TPA: helix-turn-helix domain-containing protein [Candidatus Binataceae bacterium]|nr:helix-turn-helix domain-containing protein [Candidatus Binataceae bacterium]
MLGSAAGESMRALAARLGVTERTVCLWRRRYREAGVAGLRTLPRAGRPRQITAAREKAVLSATLRRPAAATHWSTRRLAKAVFGSAHRAEYLAVIHFGSHLKRRCIAGPLLPSPASVQAAGRFGS